MNTSQLIERVKVGSGADRELGREVLLALGWERSSVGHFCGPLYWWTAPKAAAVRGLYGPDDDLLDITTSLDAVIALVEAKGFYGRIEPRFFIDGEYVRWRGYAIKPLWDRYTPCDDWFETHEASASSPARALLAALLTALQSKDQTNG